MSAMSRTSLLILAASVIAGCGKAPFDDGLIKHHVTGVITVNGQPLDRVVVRFQNTDKSVDGNAAQPTGHTDAEGKFSLSTSGDKDGAVAGEYVVTFLRASADYSSGKDLFRNKFINPAKSEHHVTVPDHDLEVPTIDLKVPSAWLTTPQKDED